MPAKQTRTCVGCGRKAGKTELLRFVATRGRLTHAQHATGRGAYTCHRLACFERAAARRAFSRGLRRTVQIEPGLEHLDTDPPENR